VKTKVIRPFILNSKDEINNFLKRNDLTKFIAEDPLNLDLTRRRNWIRMVLLPQIKEKTNVEKVVKKKYLEKLKKA
jgi:tRNA(Ile)-lysidine synthase TilS/MesJ